MSITAITDTPDSLNTKSRGPFSRRMIAHRDYYHFATSALKERKYGKRETLLFFTLEITSEISACYGNFRKNDEQS